MPLSKVTHKITTLIIRILALMIIYTIIECYIEYAAETGVELKD